MKIKVGTEIREISDEDLEKELEIRKQIRTEKENTEDASKIVEEDRDSHQEQVNMLNKNLEILKTKSKEYEVKLETPI